MKVKSAKALLLISLLFLINSAFAEPSHYISLFKEMFTNMVVKKNSQAISTYYDKQFVLHSNGNVMKFDDFTKFHQSAYKTPITYKISYDDATLVEQGNKVAGRMFITAQMPNESPHKIEVIFIAEYKGDKLLRVWELTFPDWSKMKTFQNIQK